MPLADNLARLRITDGKTIQEVADGAKVPPALVAAIEAGRVSVPPKSLRSLAAYFGVGVDTLMR
ncbi:XRE family transcriptional regulator [Aureimonas flava]|uniref:XRE family transcriptional regulator n=1 Tax=Aureimonas flava TaxID=2320271 RepID=A0A3A1WM13_9HYPH|nr:helix-turn-helix transcriptional regulator [Aureimonas flava]RIY01475.1 XRE family transcriptional regulator [Aureimonas flava]